MVAKVAFASAEAWRGRGRERDEDLKPLLVSWGIALATAAAWLAVVHLTPPAVVLTSSVQPELPPSIDFTSTPHVSAGTPSATTATKMSRPARIPNEIARQARVAEIFAGTVIGRTLVDVSRLIPGVQTVRATVAAAPTSRDKSPIATGDAAARPGISSFTGGGKLVQGTGNLGAVSRGATIDRADFHARPLPAVRALALENATADPTELGAFVRARVAQLQSCYERAGGTDLAGVVALRLTIGTGGLVRAAEIVRRTWSGPGAAEAEGCLLTIARGWRLPSGREGTTVTLPISFTRGS